MTRDARTLSRTASILLALLLAVWAVLLPAAPASAHDALTGQDPAAGASMPLMPEQISLTFNNNPVALGSQISITDAEGESWNDGSAQIVDNQAVQAVRGGAPAGVYSVAWRVVSSDGHPIEGTFDFTVTDGATGSAESSAATQGAAAPSAGAGTAAPIETGTPESGSESTSVQQGIPWSVIGMIAVLVALGVVIAVLAKRRLGRPGQ